MCKKNARKFPDACFIRSLRRRRACSYEWALRFALSMSVFLLTITRSYFPWQT
jgi:hypothetical protein